MNNTNYQVLTVEMNYQYIKKILFKYHKASEFLYQQADNNKFLNQQADKNQPNPSEEYSTFIEEYNRLQKLPEPGNTQLDTYKGVRFNMFFKQDINGEIDVLDMLNITPCSQMEIACMDTLAVIIMKYCSHDYPIYFSKQENSYAIDEYITNFKREKIRQIIKSKRKKRKQTLKSVIEKRKETVRSILKRRIMIDKFASDYDDKFISDAYSTLNDLKNLLLFKEQGFKNNNMTFDHTEERDIEQGKKKTYILKENQILIKDPKVLSKITNMLIEEKLENILVSQNVYINVLKFQSYTAETLTFKFANKEFETVRGLVETPVKGKKPSQRAVFKGMISKLVKKYVKDEQLTISNKSIDERGAQLIAYHLLSMFGFISLDLINGHKNRDSRIKYMDSLPYWEDEAILPNHMQLISLEDMIKKYSPS